MAESIRIERARFGLRGMVVSLVTGDPWLSATGVGLDPDLRKALPMAWRDLAKRSGRPLATLKALPRAAPLLRVKR